MDDGRPDDILSAIDRFLDEDDSARLAEIDAFLDAGKPPAEVTAPPSTMAKFEPPTASEPAPEMPATAPVAARAPRLQEPVTAEPSTMAGLAPETSTDLPDGVPQADEMGQTMKGATSGVIGAKGMVTAAQTIPLVMSTRRHLAALEAFDTIDAGDTASALRRLHKKAGAFGGGQYELYLAEQYANASPEDRAAMRQEAAAKIATNDEAKNNLVAIYNQYQEEMKPFAPRVGDIRDIKDLRDFGDWFAWNFGQGLPYIGAAIASGAVAGPAGLGLFGMGMGAGDVQGGRIEAGKVDEAGDVLAWALPYAALEYLGPAARMFRGTTREGLQKAAELYFARLGKKMTANGVEEFVNEFGQEVIKHAAVTSKTGEKLITDESVWQFINAGAGGFAAGSPFGAVEAGLPGGRKPRPAPPGERERAAATPPPSAPGDDTTAIPKNLIDEGRKVFQDLDATRRADEILQRNGMPKVGTRVSVDRNGKIVSGVVDDAFSESNAELGLSGDGVKIRLDDGSRIEEFFDTLTQAGVRISDAAAAGPAADIAAGVPTTAEDVARQLGESGAGLSLEPQSTETLAQQAPATAAQPSGTAETRVTVNGQTTVTRRGTETPPVPEATPADADAGAAPATPPGQAAAFPETATQSAPAPTVTPAAAPLPAVAATDAQERASAPQGVDIKVNSPGPQEIAFVDTPSTPKGEGEGGGISPSPVVEEEANGRFKVTIGSTAFRGDKGKPFASRQEAEAFARAKATPAGDGTRAAPVKIEAPEHLDVGNDRVETDPTPAQAEAGNYPKKHVKVAGLDITVENPKDSIRSKKDAETGETRWSVRMPADYGYIKRTIGADSKPGKPEQFDVYIGPDPNAETVYVVDQIDPKTGKFDEHKAVLGVGSEAEAIAIYDAGFSDGSGPKRRGAVTAMRIEQFREYLKGDTTKALAYREPGAEPATQAAFKEKIRQKREAAKPKDDGFEAAQEAGRQRLARDDAARDASKGLPAGYRMEVNSKDVLILRTPTTGDIVEISPDVSKATDAQFRESLVEGLRFAKDRARREGQSTAPATEHPGLVIKEPRTGKTTEIQPKGTTNPDWIEIGKNADGETLYEDKRGVRSVVKNGVRVTETVGLIPTREGVKAQIKIDSERDKRYLPVPTGTQDAAAAPPPTSQPAPTSENIPADRPRQRASTAGPVDAITFLARNGGLRDDEGHGLKQRRNLQRLIPGAGMLIREDGNSVDEAGLILFQEGYFRERPTSEAEILDFIERAARSKVYRPQDEAEVAARQNDAEWMRRLQDAKDELRSLAKDMGELLTTSEIDALADEMAATNQNAETVLSDHIDRTAIAWLDENTAEAKDDSYAPPAREETGPAQGRGAAGESSDGRAPVAGIKAEVPDRGAPAAEAGSLPAAEATDRVDTADGPRQQAVIPGAERLSEAETAEAARSEKEARAADEKRLAGQQSKLRKGNQQSVNDQEGGLFGEARKRDQGDMLAPSSAETEGPAADRAVPADIALATALAADLAKGKAITPADLMSAATRAYGGSRLSGAFEAKDAYDAAELAANLVIQREVPRNPGTETVAEAQQTARMLNDLTARLPKQTIRSDEMRQFQQFSTPPDYAWAAVWAGAPRQSDIVLEPSAGTGNLLVHAMAAKPEAAYANELSPRRANLLRKLEPTQVFSENAEQIANILPARLKGGRQPTLVVMNPPFSQTAGRMGEKKVLETGAVHIEQALKLLSPGGRLVAIVGRGMAMDAPRFRDWWKRIGSQHDVRANVSVDGRVYERMGTSFGTRVLVIDKVAPTGVKIVTGEVTDVPSLISLLEEVRNDRPEVQPAIRAAAGEPAAAQPSREAASPGSGVGGRSEPPVLPAADRAGDGERRTDTDRAVGGQSADGAAGRPADAGVEAGRGDDVPDSAAGAEPDARGRDGAVGTGTLAGSEPAGRGETADRDAARPDAGEQSRDAGLPDRLTLEQAAEPARAEGELTEAVFEAYRPQRLKVPGAKAHPTALVQSAAMASVNPPPASYQPSLPKALIDKGVLSEAQLEAIVYAGQAHAETNNDGTRKAFFIGDGTGVGKGREISGIILDNKRQGRTKAIWLSERQKLIKDARRDWQALGNDEKDVFDVAKIKAGEPIPTTAQGIAFASYDTLRSQAKAEEGKAPKRRIEQIADWFGRDYDGVLIFDEAHNAGNAVDAKGSRGIQKASQKALAVLELQKLLPNARVVYVSATGATEVMNLAYAERLGLWGPGTPFPSRASFINEVDAGGIAAMELIARDLKSLGLYTARSLSYEGVGYERIEHKLTPEQREMYDTLAGAWQRVLANIQAVLGPEVTNAGKNGLAKSAAMSAFWSSHQRFFNQLITSMQMPSILDAAEQDLKDGKSVVMQIVNTNEASQERALAKRAAVKDEDADDADDPIDTSFRDQIVQMIDAAWPVNQYEEYVDDEGNLKTRLAVDSAGNPIINQESLAAREQMKEDVASVPVPDGPIDLILERFGTADVAEVTGRKRRIVRVRDDNGDVKTKVETRSGNAGVAEADQFQAGKRRVLIFSEAGGTGRSYHADRGSGAAGRQRVHYLVQAGWRADKAVQGFGRTHRSNQESAPVFRLVSIAEIPGQRRFVSSIARRLAQLGALTKGQRQAGDQGLFSARDNLESREARDALRWLYRDIVGNQIEGLPLGEFEQQTGLTLTDPKTGAMKADLPPVTQFLNRLLSMQLDPQRRLFEAFDQRVADTIEYAAKKGELDAGVEVYKADKIRKEDEKVVHTDERTGAETKYVRLTTLHRTKPTTLAQLDKIGEQTSLFGAEKAHPLIGFYRNARSGQVVAAFEAGERTLPDGKKERLALIHRVQSHGYGDRGQFYDRDRWQELTEVEGRKAWQQQVDTAPEFREEPLHLITGTVLPIWDRLPKGSVRIYRVQTDAGERMLGRVIPESAIDATLERLGATSDQSLTPERAYDRIAEKGETAYLANGWRLVRTRQEGQRRVRIEGPMRAHDTELREAGVLIETRNYERGYYLPTGAEGPKVLAAITGTSRPISRWGGVSVKNAPDDVTRGAVEEPPIPATPEANIARGRTAMERILAAEKGQARFAMWRPEIGWIGFRWGTERHGILHIIVERESKDRVDPYPLLRDVPEVMARGRLHPFYVEKGALRRNITYVRKTVVLEAQKDARGNVSWIATAFYGTREKAGEGTFISEGDAEKLVAGVTRPQAPTHPRTTQRDLRSDLRDPALRQLRGSSGPEPNISEGLGTANGPAWGGMSERAGSGDTENVSPAEADRKLREIEAELQKIANRLFPGLNVRVVEKPIEEDGQVLAARYSRRGAFALAEISYRNTFKVPRTPEQMIALLGHEGGIHYLRDMNVFTKTDWALFKNAEKAEGWRRTFNIESKYRGKSEDEKSEESAAHAFQRWLEGQLTVPASVNRIFTKIRRFIEAVGKWWRGEGRTYQDVFRDIAEGVYGRQMRAQRAAAVDETGPMGLSQRFMATAGGRVYFSTLEDAIARLPARGTGKQMLATLRNTPGVKPAELVRTGTDEWLEQQERVTREQIAEHFAANKVEIREVMKRAGRERPSAIQQRNVLDWLRNEYGEPDANAEITEADVRAAADGDRVKVAALEGMGVPDDLLEPFRNHAGGEEGPQFAQYTLPGGESYREVLLTLPERSPTPQEIMARDGRIDLTNKHEIAPAFTGGHFIEPNVLAHVRLTDRTDVDGKRVLFVEELQSDWAQAARKLRDAEIKRIAKERGVKKPTESSTPEERAVWVAIVKEVPADFGYQKPERQQQVEAERARVAELGAAAERADTAAREWRPPPGMPATERIAERARLTRVAVEARNAWADAETALMAAGRRQDGRVPDRPFKETEEWAGLALRRVLKMAVDEGYDRVAWTTGEQQNERYDLSKHIDALRVVEGNYEGAGGAGYRVTAHKDGREVINRDVPADGLADVIGKDMADKAIQTIEENKKRSVPKYSAEFSGLDLKVGGTGMVGFYDKILPAYANSFGKKYGAKVGQTKIPVQNVVANDAGGGEFEVFNVMSGETVARFPSAEAARADAVRRGHDFDYSSEPTRQDQISVHSIDVTPAMRTALESQGIATFGAVEDQADVSRAAVEDSGEPRPARPADASDSIAFDNPQSEARWQDARKGVGDGASLIERMGAWFSQVASEFTRHYRFLPNEARFSDVREQLRKLEAAPQASKETVIRNLRRITDGMTQADLDLFTRKVVLDDLAWEVEQEHDLPFGMTPDDVARERAKVDEILDRRPDLAAAVRQRKLIVRSLSAGMVEAGVLSRDRINNPDYYRHQVLDHARATKAFAKGVANRLRSPYWARRMGSTLDINANLLEAEFDWQHKAFTDIETAKTIQWIKDSEHNIRAEVIAAAREHNQRLIDRMLAQDMEDHGQVVGENRETGEPIRSSPMNDVWKGFRQRIAIGLGKVRAAVERGETHVPEQFEAAAARLVEEADNEAAIFPFLAWIMENSEAGSAGAAQVFKAISQRREWVKAQLGNRYADPMDVASLVKRFAPEGYVAWQPEEGKLLYTAKTLPEHVIDRMMALVAASTDGPIDMAELQAAMASVRPMLAVGGNKYEMVIPQELADTLNSLRDQMAEETIATALSVPLRWWKRWVLINPRRVIKYNLNNLSGDLDAVIAGNPRAIKRMPQAIKELYHVMLKGEAPSERYREAVERGVFDSGLTVQEIPDINFLSEFEALIQKPTLIKRLTLSPLMKVWRALQRYTQFRENWLRYAAYLDYVERLEAGETMQQIGYGAAKREMVDAIEDTKDKAALLARELVGDYGAVSHKGRQIRRTLVPFWSWLEINTKRYTRLIGNAFGQGIGQGARTAGIIGAGIGMRTTAYLLLRMAVLYAAVQLWNNLVFGDDEDELDEEERARLHLLLGRDSDGNIRSLRFQGAFSDYLAWIGFEDVVKALSAIEKGRGDASDVLKAIAKAPVNKIASGITPVIKVPVEGLAGQSFWPDVFRPMPIRDQGRNLARTFAVEHEYDLVFDRPSRGYGRSWTEAVVNSRDAGEIAYNRSRGLAYEWLRKEKGQDGSSTLSTPRSRALYEWRLAKRYGDEDAAEKALATLRELGVRGEELKASIKRAHPLAPVAIKDRRAFLATLSDREREVFDRAIEWYRETFAP